MFSATILHFSLSFILFIVSFILSLRSNILVDALIRSFIVFFCSFVLLYLFSAFVKQVRNSNAKTEATEGVSSTESKPATSTAADKPENEPHDSSKGSSIDLQTPDDEETFIPFKPRKLNDSEE